MSEKNKSNSGRKPLPLSDKKELVRLYIPRNIIDKNGGVKSVQEICYNALGYKK